MALNLSTADHALVERASELVAARADGDRHTVAAAARDVSGRIITGLNVYHFTGGPCAGLVLLGNAAAAGLGPLDTIVAVADGDRGILSPCGRCRQVLFDYQRCIRVIVSSGGRRRVVPIYELLPMANLWTSETGAVPT